MKPVILMGDPTYFRIVAGSNPFTRNWLGIRKGVSRSRAIQQWHDLARLLTDLSVDVYVIPPVPDAPGLVYPANAGVLAPNGTFVLSNLIPARAVETPHYRRFLNNLGVKTAEITQRFEGEADLIPVGKKMLFTYGNLEEQRFIPKWGIPPWKRIYGFRSDVGAKEKLERWFPRREFVMAQLIQESFYHGDTCFCSFGDNREHLLAYLDAVSSPSQARLRQHFKDKILELSPQDARLYAANSFYLETDVVKALVMPEGVSRSLLDAVAARGVQPLLINVSEFLVKGGGSVKCMIGTLGVLPKPANEEMRKFRESHLYSNVITSLLPPQ